MTTLHERGQGLVEYSLLASLTSLVLIAVLMLLGPRISNLFDSLRNMLSINGIQGTWIPEQSPIKLLFEDFQTRTLEYYDYHGRWPRRKAPRNFTDIGLDPSDWGDPINGISWTPRGENIRLRNERGDNIQIYINDLDGNTLQLYDGWDIWCPVTASTCYYQSIQPGNEVDINSIQFVEE